jgi:protein-S-isoprenylcysteine O-methyltransferase Ste14
MMNLTARAVLALAGLGVVLGLLLFLPAGTARYWQAWIYLSIFTGTSLLITVQLLRHDRALLERRMRGGPSAEKQPAQKFIMRFGWSEVPLAVVVLGDLLVLVGFYLISLVYRANTFASATIEVTADQKVISTGPYAIVRHPMYASASLYLLGTPLALGSYWGFLALGAMMPFLIWRLVDEERYLAKNLSGYTEYQKTVRHRLVPFVW